MKEELILTPIVVTPPYDVGLLQTPKFRARGKKLGVYSK